MSKMKTTKSFLNRNLFMKKFLVKIISLFIVSLFFTLSTAYAQKIPFQGQLLENDAPVNGTRNFVFSIAGVTWTETQANIPISNGLYSVVIGSTTPIPADLFNGVESRQLNITVGSLALTPLTIYPSMVNNTISLQVDAASTGKNLMKVNLNGQGTAGQLYESIVGTSSVDNGINLGVSGYGKSSTATTDNTYGLYGESTGDGSAPHLGLYTVSTGKHVNYGGLTVANGNGKYNIGLRGLSIGEGDGDVSGYQNGSYNTGIQGYARSNAWGNVGVYGWAYNPSTGQGLGVDNIGVVGRSEVNNGTTNVLNQGVYGEAKGTGINKGVVGRAFGGVQNWAGWFDGDVKINGKIESVGGLTFDKTTDAAEMEEVNGLFARVAGNGSGSARYSGIFGISEASSGFNAGLKGVAVAKTTNTSFTYGVVGEVLPDSNGPSKGIVYGVRGEVYTGNYDGGSVALRALSRNTSTVVSGLFANTGGYLDARDNPNQNVGVFANAVGGTTSKNYGVWAKASGGAENLAGLFEGDVKITGKLDLTNGITSNNISGTQFTGKGTDSEVNFLLGQNFFFGGNDSANRGLLSLFGGVEERNVTNVDIRRVDLSVSDDGFGRSVGRLNLGGPVGGEFGYRGFVKTGAKTDDGTNYHGELTLLGQSTINIELGAKRWEGAEGYNRPFLSMKGNQNDQAPNLVWLEVGAFEGKEFGNITFTSSDGRSSRIGANDMAMGDPFNGEGTFMNGTNGDGILTGNVQVGKPFITDGNGIFLGKDGNANFSQNINAEGNIAAGKPFETTGVFLDKNGFGKFTGGVDIGGNIAAPSAQLNGDVTNNIRMYGKSPDGRSHIALDGGANHIYLWGNGDIDATGNITAVNVTANIQSPSDKTLKTNIKELQNSLTKTLKLRGVSYNWIDRTKSQKTQIGVIAQEVEQIYPEFVSTNDYGFKSVNYSQMVAVLIESIKELNTSIEKLQAENENLKAELTQVDANAKKIAELEQTMQSLLSMMKSTTTRVAEQGSASDQEKK